jgi:hypothetical protein
MAEIRWIDRGKDGRICGHYACKQRDGQESLPEDSEELAEFEAYIKNPEIRLPIEEFAKKQIELLDNRVKEYVYSKYPIHRQISLQKLQTDARLGGNIDAATYTDLVWTWMQTVFAYYYAKEDEIVAIAANEKLSEIEKKAAITDVIMSLDLTPYDETDPKVTIRETIVKLTTQG